MMKSFALFCLGTLCMSQSVVAQTRTDIRQFNLSGPYPVSAPVSLDTVDVQGKKFDETVFWKGMSLDAPATEVFSGKILPSVADSRSVGLLTFYVNNRDYLKGKVVVKGPKNYKMYIDGKEAGEELKLAPEHHTFSIQFLAQPKDTDSIQVYFDHLRSVIPIWFMILLTVSA